MIRGTGPAEGRIPALSPAVMDRVPYPMATMSEDGKIIFANAALVTLLGYPDADTLLDAPLFDVFAQPKAIVSIRDMIQTEGVVDGLEIELYRYNGTPVSLLGVFHEFDGGDGPAWQATLIDVTDRRTTEEALTRSEARYRTLFEQSPVGVWEMDFSALDGWFEGLRALGLENLREHLRHQPEDLDRALSLVKVVDVNAAGSAISRLWAADHHEVLPMPLDHIEGGFVEQLCAIWANDGRFDADMTGQSLDGRQMTYRIQAAVPETDGRTDLSRLIIAIDDVTEKAERVLALQEAEQLFHSLFDSAPVGFALVDPTGLIVDANRSFWTLAGQTAPGMQGIGLQQVVHADDMGAFTTGLSELKAGDMPFIDSHVRFVRPDRTIAWVSTRSSIVGDIEDRPTFVAVHTTDVTELRNSHAELVRFFEDSPVPFYRKTVDGHILDANLAFLRLLGYDDLRALQSVGLTSLYRDLARRNEFETLLMEKGVVDGFEHELLHASGSSIWVRNSARLVEDAPSGPARIEGMLVDITKRRMTVDALLASQTVSRNLFRRNPVALLSEDFSGLFHWIDRIRATGVTDFGEYLAEYPDAIDGALRGINILDANPAAIALLEADNRDQLVGPIATDLAMRSLPSFAAQVVALAEGRDQFNIEAPGQTLKGRPIELAVSWVVSPASDATGSSPALISLVDVTDRRDTERRLRELNLQKDALIASVAHELRTPITAVVGFAYELRDNWDDISSDLGRECIKAISSASLEVSHILDDLLTATQLDLGRVTTTPSSIDLVQQAERTIENFTATGRTGIHLKGDSTSAWADPGRVQQILRNLLASAVMHGGPHIEIETSSRDGMATLTVRDDGDEKDPGDVERAFEGSGHVGAPPTQPASIGIGLRIARELARSMGGDVTHSHMDGWTTFKLDVPATESNLRTTAIHHGAAP